MTLARRCRIAVALAVIVAGILTGRQDAAADDGALQRQNNAGIAAMRSHDFTKASRLFETGLQQAQRRHDRAYSAKFLRNVGVTYDHLGRYASAVQSHERAVAIYHQLGDLRAEQQTLSAIGVIYTHWHRYDDAVAAERRALAVDRGLHDRLGQARDLRSVASTALDGGRYGDALEAAQEALAIDRDAGNVLNQAVDLTYIGGAYSALGRDEDALAAHGGAFALYDKLDSRALMGEALGNAAMAAAALGRYPQALAGFQAALSIARERRDHHSEAVDLNAIANVFGSWGRYDEALGAHRQALVLNRRLHDRAGEAQSLLNIGLFEESLGKNADARRDATSSVRLYRALGAAELWRSLDVLARAESNLGDRHQAEAQRHYDEALDRIEQLRAGLTGNRDRASFFGTTVRVYDRYIELLLNLNQRYPGKGFDRKAFDVFERKAARAALEQIAASAAGHFAGVPREVVEQEAASDVAVSAATQRYTQLLTKSDPDPDAIRSASSKLAKARKHQASAERQTRMRYPHFYDLRHARPIGLDALRRDVLQPGDVMLIYAVLDRQSALWVVARDRFQLVALPGRTDLDRAVAAVREHIESIESGSALPAKDLSTFARDSYLLYRLVIPESATTVVGQARNLVVVPSGSLYQVPFAAFVSRDPAADPMHAHYLIEDVPITYSPSASLFAVVAASYSGRETAKRPLLAFANPTFSQVGDVPESRPEQPGGIAKLQLDAMRSSVERGSHSEVLRGTFPPLPGTATEADAVRVALDAGGDSVVAGDDATRRRVFAMNRSGQLKQYRYVLFATHAVLPDQIEGLTQPAIVLAHPERGDGFLTMADVFELSLNADFVMLSACATGVVADPRGDGISGLTRAFLFAGTPAISVTLWQVDDAAAPRITPRFFAGMRARQSAAQSLRAAQTAMIESTEARFRHPFAWAPFVIFGDGSLASP